MSLSIVTDGFLQPYFFDVIKIREQITTLEPVIIESKSLMVELVDQDDIDTLIVDSDNLLTMIDDYAEINARFKFVDDRVDLFVK